MNKSCLVYSVAVDTTPAANTMAKAARVSRGEGWLFMVWFLVKRGDVDICGRWSGRLSEVQVGLEL